METEKLITVWWLVLLLGSSSVVFCCWASSDGDGAGGYHVHRGRPVLSTGISPSISSHRIASSVVLPAYGNVYPRGFYYVLVNVGQPPKPYFLDPDTGSDLTWLQCDAPCARCTAAPHPYYRPGNDLVPCKDPFALHCNLKDIIPLNFTSGVRHSRLAIGCGYDQIPGSSFHQLDGVLGLGKGKASIVSQLHDQGIIKNVMGHCFSGSGRGRGGGGGYIFFGDGLFDPSGVVWTPMSRDFSNKKHYSPGPAELIYGGKSTRLKNLHVIFDSGSSYTYFASQPYQTLVNRLKKELVGKPLRDAVEDEALPLCWKGREPFKSITDVRGYFKPLALRFEGRARGKAPAQFELPPEAYLIISLQGNACLGILNGTEVGLHNFNLIGDISMQDKTVIYDNEKQMIGWAPTNCEHLPEGRPIAS
ncbi:hypothetical protein Dimus_021600 [Dionaea muscipula]